MLYPIQARAINDDIGFLRPYQCWLIRMQHLDDDAENPEGLLRVM